MPKKHIQYLMEMIIADYLISNGSEKVVNQEILITNDLSFNASCSLNNKQFPIFEFSIGLGYYLAKASFSIIKNIFDKEISDCISPLFSDIKNLNTQSFKKYEDNVVAIDKELTHSLDKIRELNLSASDYWFRLFEYSLGFVILHELGHYLNGHNSYFIQYKWDAFKYDSVLYKERHIAELQSDVFAVQTVFNSSSFYDVREKTENYKIASFEKVGDLNWYKCVSNSIFLVFVIFEQLELNQEYSTHPNAFKRIINCLKHIVRAYSIYNVVEDKNDAVEFCIKLMEDVTELCIPLKIDTTEWISSLSMFWDDDLNTKKEISYDMHVLAELQMKTSVFRYKVGNYSVRALEHLNSNSPFFNSTVQLIALSGNHIPWEWLNHEDFYKVAFNRIKFSDPRVIKMIKSNHLFNDYRNDLLEYSKQEIKYKKMKMNNIQSDFNKFQGLSENELFSKIGSELLKSNTLNLASNGNSETEIDEQEFGKKWYEKYEEVFQEKVCNSHIYQMFVTDEPKYENTLLYASVADVISGICVGVSPIVVSVLIIKKGLSNFCKSYFENI